MNKALIIFTLGFITLFGNNVSDISFKSDVAVQAVYEKNNIWTFVQSI